MAKELDGEVALRRAVERTRHERDRVECRLVAPQRALILGAAIGEIEHRPGQRPTREVPHLGNVVAGALPRRGGARHQNTPPIRFRSPRAPASSSAPCRLSMSASPDIDDWPGDSPSWI